MSMKKNKDKTNPFEPGTMRAALYEEDFSDLTIDQIAEVFAVDAIDVRAAIKSVRGKGKEVIYTKKHNYPATRKGR